MPKGIYIRTTYHGQRISAAKKGKPTRVWTDEERLKHSLSQKGKPKPAGFGLAVSERNKGSKSHFWKGGVTEKNLLERNSQKYKKWRKAIFKRDNYTCVECGARGVRLNADHIKPFAVYIKLRYELSNGRTLCVPCHVKTPTYGFKFYQ